MTAYLREDLWARPFIERAEACANGDEIASPIRPMTRWNFAQAAVVAAAQTVIFAVPTAFMLVAHVFASVTNYVVPNGFSLRVSEVFYDCGGKFWGSFISVFVATLSATTSTEISGHAREWLFGMAANDWKSFKEHEMYKLFQRVDKVRTQRLAACKPEELCRTGSMITCTNDKGKTFKSDYYFDAHAEQMKKKVRAQIHILDDFMAKAGPTKEEKYQRFQEAARRIHAYVEKKSRTLHRLPMTYAEVADWDVEQSHKLKGKAVKMVMEQASTVGRLKKREYGEKFDLPAFNQRVQGYAQEVIEDFDGKIESMAKRRGAVKDEWDREVVPLKSEENSLISQIQGYVRWLNWFGWLMSKEDIQQQQMEAQQLDQQLQQVRARKRLAINRIRTASFRKLQGEKLSYHKHFNSYVEPCNVPGINPWRLGVNRSITRRINKLTEPNWTPWMWRGVGSTLCSWMPGFMYNEVEDIFDPDVKGPKGILGNWLAN